MISFNYEVNKREKRNKNQFFRSIFLQTYLQMKGEKIYHSNKSGKDEQYKCIFNKSKDTCISRSRELTISGYRH